MSNFYILDKNGAPQKALLLEWAKWFENTENRIMLNHDVNGYRVSTIFLGVDHNFSGGKPLLFETMVFRNDNGESKYQDRYYEKEEALEGHAKAIEMCKTGNFDYI